MLTSGLKFIPVLLIGILGFGCAQEGSKAADAFGATPASQVSIKPAHPESAFSTGIHRNLFVEMEVATAEEVRLRIQKDYQTLFFGDPEEEALLVPAGKDMAFILTPDTDDIRSEGMSYGMIIAVMMDDKTTFDKLWRFSHTYMQVKHGDMQGYFSWQLRSKPPYTYIDLHSAPDGEEYFAMSLFFAHARWGSASGGVLDYRAQANQILHDMVHKDTPSVRPLMNSEHKQIVFTTSMGTEEYTDPSYHLPAFYELWARWADKDNEYWQTVAQTSREFFKRAAHPQTGLFPEYASFEGAPQRSRHNNVSHMSGPDAYRVIQNIAMDYAWFSQSAELGILVDRQLSFYHQQGLPLRPRQYVGRYELDGRAQVAYRPQSLVAMTAVGALASTSPIAKGFVEDLWSQPVPTGQWRYYNGLLHMMGMLHVAGEFKIHGNPQLR